MRVREDNVTRSRCESERMRERLRLRLEDVKMLALKREERGPGWVAPLVIPSSPYVKPVDLIYNQGTYRNQPMALAG